MVAWRQRNTHVLDTSWMRWFSIIVIALATSACVPAPSASTADPASAAPKFYIENARPGLPEVRVVAREFEFGPVNVTVPANEPFTLVLDNTGGVVEHDLDVPALGGLHIHAMPHSEARGTMVIVGAPGRYDFSCTLPGHKEAGMRGSMVVAPASAR
jgi:plastocyanin